MSKLEQSDKYQNASVAEKNALLNEWAEINKQLATEQGAMSLDMNRKIDNMVSSRKGEVGLGEALSQGLEAIPGQMKRAELALRQIDVGQRGEDILAEGIQEEVDDILQGRSVDEIEHLGTRSYVKRQLRRLEIARENISAAEGYGEMRKDVAREMDTLKARGVAEAADDSLLMTIASATPQVGADVVTTGALTFLNPVLGFSYGAARAGGGVGEELLTNEVGQEMNYSQMMDRVKTTAAMSGILEISPFGWLSNAGRVKRAIKPFEALEQTARQRVISKALGANALGFGAKELGSSIGQRALTSLASGAAEGFTELGQGIVERIAANVEYDQVKVDTILEVAATMDKEQAAEFLLGAAMGTTIRGVEQGLEAKFADTLSKQKDADGELLDAMFKEMRQRQEADLQTADLEQAVFEEGQVQEQAQRDAQKLNEDNQREFQEKGPQNVSRRFKLEALKEKLRPGGALAGAKKQTAKDLGTIKEAMPDREIDFEAERAKRQKTYDLSPQGKVQAIQDELANIIPRRKADGTEFKGEKKRKLKLENDLKKAQQEVDAEMNKVTRNNFGYRVKRAFGLSEQQSKAVSKVIDSVAQTWAKNNNAKVEDWYTQNISRIQKGTEAQRKEAFEYLPGERSDSRVEFVDDTQAVITAFEDADVDTAVRSLSQVVRKTALNPEQTKVVEDWAGVKDGRWTDAARKKFADGMESYLYDGKSPNKKIAKAFQKISEWMGDIYKRLTGRGSKIEISPEMRAVFDEMFSGERTIGELDAEVTPQEVQLTEGDQNRGGQETDTEQAEAEVETPTQEVVQESDQVQNQEVPTEVEPTLEGDIVADLREVVAELSQEVGALQKTLTQVNKGVEAQKKTQQQISQTEDVRDQTVERIVDLETGEQTPRDADPQPQVSEKVPRDADPGPRPEPKPKTEPKKSGFIDYTKLTTPQLEAIVNQPDVRTEDGTDVMYLPANPDAPLTNPQEVVDAQAAQRELNKRQRKEEVSQRRELPFNETHEFTEAGLENADLKLRDVFKMFADILNIPIKRGGYKFLHKLADAGYIESKDVIRIKNANDIYAVVHEIGHAIHKKFGKDNKDLSSRERAELLNLGQQTSMKGYTEDQILHEGHAEFFREYVFDRDRAKYLAPEFFNTFQELMLNEPKLGAGINTAIDAFQTFTSMNALEQEMAGVVNKDKVLSDDRTKKEKLADLKRTTNYNHFDDTSPLHYLNVDILGEEATKKLKVSENAQKLMQLVRGAPAIAAEFIKNGIYVNGVKKSKGMSEFVQKDKRRRAADNAYMKAHQNLWYHRENEIRKAMNENEGTDYPMMPVSSSKEKAYKVIAVFEAQYGEKYATELRANIKKWHMAGLDYALENNLIDQKEYKAMSANGREYFPMHRAYRTRGYNPFKGRHGDTMDTFEGFDVMEGNTVSFVQRSFMQKVYEQLDVLAKQPGAAAFLEEVDSPSTTDPDQQVISFVSNIDGEKKRRYYEIKDKVQYDLLSADRVSAEAALAGMEIETTMKKLTQGSSSVFRYTATMNPAFVAGSAFRDPIVAAMQTKANLFTEKGVNIYALPFFNLFRGFYLMYFDKALRAEYEMSGASQATRAKWAGEPSGIKTLEMIRAFSPFKAMEAIAQFVEQAPRINEYAMVKQQALDNGMSEPAAKLEGAHAARNVTQDFSVGGKKAKEVNKNVAFWTAILGGSRMIKEQLSTPGGVAKFAVYMLLPEIVNFLVNDGDEEYDELPEYEKDGYWHVPLGIGSASFTRLPKPPGYAHIANMLRVMMKSAKEGDASRLLDIITKNKDAMKQMLVSRIPTAAKGPSEAFLDYSFFKERNIINPYMKDLPLEYQYTSATSEMAKYIGPKIGMSPMIFDHLLLSYTTRYGELTQGVSNLARKDTEMRIERNGLSQMLGASRFMRSMPTYDAQSLHDLTTLSDKIKGIRKAEKNQDAAGKKEIREEYGELLAQEKMVNRAMTQIRAGSKRVRSILDREMPIEQKRKQVGDIYKGMIKTARIATGKDK